MLKLQRDIVERKLIEASKSLGIYGKEADYLAEYYLDADLRGMHAYGVTTFVEEMEIIKQRGGPCKVIKDTPIISLIDAQKELGVLAAKYSVDILLEKIREQGFGLVGLKNASRYSHLAPFGLSIANAGFIGIVMNSAGPSAVAPYNSFTPILGTNPICMAFPCGNQPAVIMDFATSEVAWSEITQAFREERDLRPSAFYKKNGEFAIKPEDVYAVKAFDNAKGFAFCLAIELFCGALIGTKMGNSVVDEYDLGFVFIGINPCLFRDDLKDFVYEVDILTQEIREATPLDSNTSVHIPGDNASKRRINNLRKNVVEINEKSWDELCEIASTNAE